MFEHAILDEVQTIQLSLAAAITEKGAQHILLLFPAKNTEFSEQNTVVVAHIGTTTLIVPA